ncbi:YCL012C [Zygosaccharomyces parabailii]|uniref:ZYBA0S06-01288g1_1 n=1 Tax=Zygosaccharomyces bailii (strain CLIB 213 / ATCC 58445 / CBS 680 / BCRC 21525 / NBRC 1098 / NCYC 1416 / NRRL Y-2227) TaxID=1333698 RepID=A0A8J2T765_ZYGB2|nr:YCL012C [Zygosaccharomyces parabailii]CDF90131.1 ZYBA0S06-01288g1_1 [Zygosaccharomyces bailii CLIB 213]SJM87204.1 related to UPF0357 protein YCL012C [Zygosaccharomyces bailii]
MSILHAKFIIGFLVVICLVFLAYRNKRRMLYRFRERYFRLRRGMGRPTGVNDSFADDLESGLSSRNFDIMASNEEDNRRGLEEPAKQEIKEIMDTEHLSFDKARLLYTERMFDRNNIAADGTPLDPKAVTLH